MGARLRLRVDVGDVSRSLRAMGDDLDLTIRRVLRAGAADIADLSKSYMRHGHLGGSWPSSSAARLFPGLIAGYYGSSGPETSTPSLMGNTTDPRSAVSATVWSTHPAAPVWEWGGDIHPAAGSFLHQVFKQHPHMAAGFQVIHIPRLNPVVRAGDQHQPALERDLDDAVTRLVVEYGF
jgi:hypothetical protein